MKRMRKLLGGSRGTAAVEFSLLLPLLLLLVFGIIELGQAWYARQMMVNASREGARMGVLYSSTGITNQDVESHVNNLLTEAGFSFPIQVDCEGAEGSPGDLVTVQVTTEYPFQVLGNLVPGVEHNLTLFASTVMRHE